MKINFDFTGQRVLVTGSTMGIGKTIAQAFWDNGATVVINGRSETSVARAISELGGDERYVGMAADLSVKEQREKSLSAMLEQLGGIDIVINNAGRGDDCMLDDITVEYVENMLDLNLKAAFFTSKICLPSLKKNQGCIVNVSSALGLVGGPPGSAIYSMTKSAIIQLSKMMALELAVEGVRVNCMCPGWIDTPMIQKENALAGDNSLYDYVADTTPVGRIGKPEECAGAILYLASSIASYTTGAVLAADGGIAAGRYSGSIGEQQ